MKCIACNKETGTEVKVLQLRTMHVRGLTGEDKYQVPDDAVTSFGVCENCARQWLAQTGWKGQPARRKMLAFSLVLCAGIVIAVVFRGKDQVLLTTGLAAVFCGIAGLCTTYRGSMAEKTRFLAMSEKEAMEEAAYKVLLQHAPAKMKSQNGDWNITYLPVTEKTLKTKPGDLMVMYDIQPAVAKEVMQKIGHPEA